MALLKAMSGPDQIKAYKMNIVYRCVGKSLVLGWTEFKE